MKIMEKLTKGYQVTVSKEQWMTVSKTINLYHQLIAGPIFVKSDEDVVVCAFEYRIWNEKKLDMMLSALLIQIDSIKIEEI